jgi:formylmethanofuran dehydrogenase subunit D
MVQSEIDQLTGAARDHLFMNVDDMRELGLAQDERVRVRSAHGELVLRAFAAPLTRGNLQMHWPEANVLIARGPHDAGGLVPDYNAVVELEKPGAGVGHA